MGVNLAKRAVWRRTLKGIGVGAAMLGALAGTSWGSSVGFGAAARPRCCSSIRSRTVRSSRAQSGDGLGALRSSTKKAATE